MKTEETRQQIESQIEIADQKISQLKRILDELRDLSTNHSEKLSEEEDSNEHCYGAFSDTIDELLTSIDDFEEFGLNSVRNLKS